MSLLDDIKKAAEITKRQQQGQTAYENTMAKYDMPSGQVGFRMEATPITRKKEADGANPSAVAVSPMVLPTAQMPAVLPRFLPYTGQSAAATYAFEQVRGTTLSPEEELERTKLSVDRLNIQIEAAQKQTDEAWRKADAYSRMNIPQEEITAAAMEYNAANTRLQNLTAQRDRMASGYYQQENEGTIQRMSGNELFATALQLQKDLNTLQDIANQRSTMSAEERVAFVNGLAAKYGTTHTGKLAQAMMKELDGYNAQMEKQGVNIARVAEYLRRQEETKRVQAENEQLKQWAKENPAAASAASVVGSPAQGVDFLKMLTTGSGNVQDLGTYVPYDANAMQASRKVSAIREAVGEKIAGSVENENWGKALQFLYNTGMSIAESATQVALLGAGATYVMGMSAAANKSREIIERGGTNQQAFWGGIAAGAAEAIFEKVSIENLLSPKAGEKFFKSLIKQAGIEASEEAATEIANILSDAAIMGQRSEFAVSVRAYQQQGMTEQQAKQQAFLDAIGQVALSALGGAISGGVMGGGVSGLNAIVNGGRMQGDVQTPEQQNALTAQQNAAQEFVANIPREEVTSGQKNNASTEEAMLLLPEETISARENGLPLRKDGAVYKVVEIPQEKIDEIAAYIETVDNASARKKYKRIIKNLFMGQRFTNVNTVVKELAYEIGVGSKGIGEIIARQPVNAETLAMLEQLNEIVENAKYIASEPTTHEERRGIERTDVFETDTMLGDVPGTARLRVNVGKDGNNLYYATSEHKKTEAQTPQPRADQNRQRGIEEKPSADIMISPEEPTVKMDPLRVELPAEQKGTAAAIPKAQAMIEAGEPVYRIVEETGLHQGEDGELYDQFGNVVSEDAEEEAYAKMERDAIYGRIDEEGNPVEIPTEQTERKNIAEELQRFGEKAPADPEAKSPTDIENVQHMLAEEADSIADAGETDFGFAEFLQNKGVSYSKDISRNLDAAAGKNKKLREILRDTFERPLNEAKEKYAIEVRNKTNALKKTMDKFGFKAGSKESAAIQWIGEGQRQDEYGELHEYEEHQLREEFPESWEKILQAEKYFREVYDEYVGRINDSLMQIYPNAEAIAQAELDKQNAVQQYYREQESVQLDLKEELEQKIEELKRKHADAKEGTKKKADLQNSINYQTKRLKTVQEKAEKYAEHASHAGSIAKSIEADIESGDVLRNKRLMPRKDYFHHFRELEQGFAGLVNLISTPADIDAKLAGQSEFTKPKTKWAGFMQRRMGGAYKEDAIGGMLKYIPAAEYKVNIDPEIARGRMLIKGMAEATEETRNANKFIEWYMDYVNDLAGKTNPIDRPVQKLVGRKMMGALRWLNSRVKSNAIMGNVRSAVSQFFNLPNAAAYIKNPKSWSKGVKMYAQSLNKKSSANSVMQRSGFLSERYLDEVFKQFDEGILKAPDKFANWLLTFGDKQSTKLIWATAYNEALRTDQKNPIEYADDITRRSVAGRGIGEVPLTQKSQLVQLVAPFQVEVNNAWQLMKEKGKEKDALGLLCMFVGSYLMNAIVRGAFGFDVSYDPINAIIEALGEAFDDDDEEGETAWDKVLYVLGRQVGELANAMPAGAIATNYLVSDEATREKLFGESDPTRFGTGNIGLNMLAKPITSFAKGKDFTGDLMSAALNIGMPFGGKATERAIEGAQDLGWLPRVSLSTKEGLNYKKQEGGASYSAGGDVRFAIDEKNPWNIAKALLLGTFSTNEGIEYTERNKSPLSEKQTGVYEALTALKVDNTEAFDFLEGFRAIEKTEEKGKAELQREYLMNSGLSDEAKAVVYYGLLASDKEVEAMDAQAEMGADPGAVYNVIAGMRAVKKTEEEDAAAQKREVLYNSELTDEQKYEMYGSFLAGDTELAAMEKQEELGTGKSDVYNILTELYNLNKTADMINAVFSSDITDEQQLQLYYDVVASKERRAAVDRMLKGHIDAKKAKAAIWEHSKINAKDMSATDKSTEYAYWTDRQGLTETQKNIINEEFGFSSGFRAGSEQYDELKKLGINSTTAKLVYDEVRGLKPEKGKTTVSAQQKYSAIIAMDLLSEEEKLAAILAYDPTQEASTWQKYSDAVDAGLSLQEFDEYYKQQKQLISDKDANGKNIKGQAKKDKTIRLINSMNISDEEKDFLFLMDYVESGLAETPWHTNKWELPTAANGFKGTGRIRGKNEIRGKNNLR